MLNAFAISAAFVLVVASASAQCNAPGTENFDSLPLTSSPFCGVNSINTYPAGWSLDAASTNAWQVYTGATLSFGTGPTGDHTSGAGNYLYTETSGCPYSTAILNAPCFDAMGVAVPTIEFWYHMLGPAMGSLSLEEFDGANWNQIWTRSGDQGDNWFLASAPVTPVGGQVMVRFVGVSGASYAGDMAIDDVRFGNPTPPMWQENGADGYADLDGQWVNALNPTPATTNLEAVNCVGMTVLATADLNFGSNIPGTFYEMGISPAPALSIPAGAFPFGGFGDAVHLDISAPGLSFLNGSTGIVFNPLPGPGFPGSGSMTDVNVPLNFNTAIDITFQAGFTDPTIPGGVQLTQVNELHVTVVAAASVVATTVNDTSIQHSITQGNQCYTSVGMPFYGVTYTNMWVTDNGRVTFGNGDSDFTPSASEAMTGQPFVGFWTDLTPSPSALAGQPGSITISVVGPEVFRIDWNQVNYDQTGVGTTFGIEFDATTGLVSIDNLSMMVPNTGGIELCDNQLLGMSPGAIGGATSAGVTTFSAGGAGTVGAATHMLYDFYDAGIANGSGLCNSLAPGTLQSVVFTPAGANYTWQGF